MSVRDSVSGPVASIIVGPPGEVEVFTIHKALLCGSSTYFRAALNNGFAETSTQKITLDDEDPEIFRTYAAWLYEHELQQEALEKLSTRYWPIELHLIQLGIFADKRGVQSLHNDVLTMLASYFAETGSITVNAVSKAYWSIPADSKIQQLIYDDYLHQAGPKASDHDMYLKAFITDLFSKLLKDGGPPKNPPIASICDYHTHDSEKQREACRLAISCLKNFWV